MKNKKSMAVSFIFAMLLSGCSAQTSANTPADKKTPAKEDIIMSGSGQYDAAEGFADFKDLVAAGDVIVYGEVKDFEMLIPEGANTINTMETIHVIETLYGDIETGADLQLMENGGYLLINDYLDSLDEELRQIKLSFPEFAELTDDEKKTKYISMIPEGYYYPEIGDRAVYILKLSDNMDNVYRKTGGWAGKYREVEEGILAIPGNNSSLTDPEGTAQNGTVSYEELKEQILNAAK